MVPSSIDPQRALVRPRVFRAGSSLPRLLEEEIAELLVAERRQLVHLVGGRGSGKSVALRHLAAVFAGDERLLLVDARGVGVVAERVRVIVVTRERALDSALVLRIAPWTGDEALEYLLQTGAKDIPMAIAAWRRVGDAVLGPWPALASRVLDRIACGEAMDVRQAIDAVITASLSAEELAAARRAALRSYSEAGANAAVWPLLEVPVLRTTLAAQALVQQQSGDDPCTPAGMRWDQELVAAVAALVIASPGHAAMLAQRVRAADRAAASLSLLCCTFPSYRPPRDEFADLSHAYAVGADLRGVRIGKAQHANFGGADLRGADLANAALDGVDLTGAALDAAQLQGAVLTRCRAAGLSARGADLAGATMFAADLTAADCTGADLHLAALSGARLRRVSFVGANLTLAGLEQCDLDEADLREARCLGARFVGVDLRTAQLSGALLEGADCSRCDLSGTRLPGLSARKVRFDRALLTATRWQGADLRAVSLCGAGLADVDWEGADLSGADFRGAQFHLGSSRSGLIGSTTAGEGSRTGFYTDESFEQHFRRPEEVRKANLSGCDLRCASVFGADFYLVDVRGARLDPLQMAWMRRCRAIVDDAAAGQEMSG